MWISRVRAIDLLAEFEYREYRADPVLQARGELMNQMIREDEYQDLFVRGWGRPSWPVGMMLRIMYVQKEEGWSDRKLAAQLADNRRVRFLVGLPPQGPSPCRSAIIDFRRRLLRTGQHTLAFRQQQDYIAQTGLVAAEDPCAIDSTPFLTAAAQPTVVGLLQHAMRRVLLAVRGANPTLAESVSARLRIEDWLKPRFQRCSAGLASRAGRRLWQRYYRKAEKLLAAVSAVEEPVSRATCALLRRVLDERGPQGDWRVPDRITNAMDPDARFGCKGRGSRQITWHGYKDTLVTHAPTDLILNVHVMAAHHVDGDATTAVVDSLRPAFAYPARLDGDEAYTGQDARREMRRRSICLVGPRRTKKRRGRVPGGGRVARRADRARRSRIEHVHAHVVRWRHNRRCPYLGLAKAWLQATFAVCAANLVRLLTLWRQKRFPIPGLRAA